MYDLMIHAGEIYDGTIGPPFCADVGIQGDRIVRIGSIEPREARQVLDATGAAVSPGFIDFHSHADLALLGSPENHVKTLQGVTTEVIGNCGFSPAPNARATRALLEKYIAPTLGSLPGPWPWETFPEYLAALGVARPSVNTVACVGHGALRIFAMGFASQPPDPLQMRAMIGALEEGLDAGAAGMSIGLIYAPACYAGNEEIERLCHVLASRRKLLAVHMRNESDHFLASVRENLALARKTGVRLHISHLKASGAANWGQLDEVLGLIAEARAQGIEVTCDQYPYVAGSTTITVLLPQWALEGGVADMIARLRRREIRDRVRRDFEAGIEGWDCLVRANGWENIVLSWVAADHLKPVEGKTLLAIATELGKEPAEALFDLVVELQGDGAIVVFQQSEENVQRTMRQDFVVIGSDALYTGGKPHPRLYGTFPRMLKRYVRELGTLSLAEAIRKMTSRPADILGQPRRGRLREGCFADVTVFFPDLVEDRATFADPIRPPRGVRHVVVNGVPVVVEGVHSGARPGVVVRDQRSH